MENTRCKPWLYLKHGPKAQKDDPESTDVLCKSVTSRRLSPAAPMHFYGVDLKHPSTHNHGSRFLRSRKRQRPRASLALSTSPPPAPQQHRRGQSHSPQREQELCGAETTSMGAGTGNAPRCPSAQKPRGTRISYGLVERPLARTGLMGRQISSLCCSPRPFLTDPRHGAADSRGNKGKRLLQV